MFPNTNGGVPQPNKNRSTGDVLLCHLSSLRKRHCVWSTCHVDLVVRQKVAYYILWSHFLACSLYTNSNTDIYKEWNTKKTEHTSLLQYEYWVWLIVPQEQTRILKYLELTRISQGETLLWDWPEIIIFKSLFFFQIPDFCSGRMYELIWALTRSILTSLFVCIYVCKNDWRERLPLFVLSFPRNRGNQIYCIGIYVHQNIFLLHNPITVCFWCFTFSDEGFGFSTDLCHIDQLRT